MKRIEHKHMEKVGKCYFLKDLSPEKKIRMGRFLCECGESFKSRVDYVRYKKTISCGCNKHNSAKVNHGLSYHPLHQVWRTMKSRCYNVGFPGFKNYGAKGVEVCEQWMTDFVAFYKYVTSLPNAMKDGYTIDRIDTFGNYEPGNLRWADWVTQNNNKRIHYLSHSI